MYGSHLSFPGSTNIRCRHLLLSFPSCHPHVCAQQTNNTFPANDQHLLPANGHHVLQQCHLSMISVKVTMFPGRADVVPGSTVFAGDSLDLTPDCIMSNCGLNECASVYTSLVLGPSAKIFPLICVFIWFKPRNADFSAFTRWMCQSSYLAIISN
jgi:hypothetical protein